MKEGPIKEKGRAPAFRLQDASGELVRLSDFVGRYRGALFLSEGQHTRLYGAGLRHQRSAGPNTRRPARW